MTSFAMLKDLTPTLFMTKPPRLYKYESFTAQALHNLKSQAVYFASPKSFNDPYDCATFPSVKEPSDAEVEQIRAHHLADGALTPKVRRDFERSTTADLRVTFLRIGQDCLDKAVQSFLNDRGVSCFSERNESLLMWGHYGGRFRGFCLEFRSDLDLFAKARKVNYEDGMPEIDLLPLLCDPDSDEILELYCTKARDWHYEREWRCLHDKAGTVYTYPADALTGVFFGPDAPFLTLEIIALILAGQNPGVQLWRGARSKSDFSVIFEPVTYTSHLDARRLKFIPPSDA